MTICARRDIRASRLARLRVIAHPRCVPQPCAPGPTRLDSTSPRSAMSSSTASSAAGTTLRDWRSTSRGSSARNSFATPTQPGTCTTRARAAMPALIRSTATDSG